jgi:hypothetical protein
MLDHADRGRHPRRRLGARAVKRRLTEGDAIQRRLAQAAAGAP